MSTEKSNEIFDAITARKFSESHPAPDYGRLSDYILAAICKDIKENALELGLYDFSFSFSSYIHVRFVLNRQETHKLKDIVILKLTNLGYKVMPDILYIDITWEKEKSLWRQFIDLKDLIDFS